MPRVVSGVSSRWSPYPQPCPFQSWQLTPRPDGVYCPKEASSNETTWRSGCGDTHRGGGGLCRRVCMVGQVDHAKVLQLLNSRGRRQGVTRAGGTSESARGHGDE